MLKPVSKADHLNEISDYLNIVKENRRVTSNLLNRSCKLDSYDERINRKSYLKINLRSEPDKPFFSTINYDENLTVLEQILLKGMELENMAYSTYYPRLSQIKPGIDSEFLNDDQKEQMESLYLSSFVDSIPFLGDTVYFSECCVSFIDKSMQAMSSLVGPLTSDTISIPSNGRPSQNVSFSPMKPSQSFERISLPSPGSSGSSSSLSPYMQSPSSTTSSSLLLNAVYRFMRSEGRSNAVRLDDARFISKLPFGSVVNVIIRVAAVSVTLCLIASDLQDSAEALIQCLPKSDRKREEIIARLSVIFNSPVFVGVDRLLSRIVIAPSHVVSRAFCNQILSSLRLYNESKELNMPAAGIVGILHILRNVIDRNIVKEYALCVNEFKEPILLRCAFGNYCINEYFKPIDTNAHRQQSVLSSGERKSIPFLTIKLTQKTIDHWMKVKKGVHGLTDDVQRLELSLNAIARDYANFSQCMRVLKESYSVLQIIQTRFESHISATNMMDINLKLNQQPRVLLLFVLLHKLFNCLFLCDELMPVLQTLLLSRFEILVSCCELAYEPGELTQVMEMLRKDALHPMAIVCVQHSIVEITNQKTYNECLEDIQLLQLLIREHGRTVGPHINHLILLFNRIDYAYLALHALAYTPQFCIFTRLPVSVFFSFLVGQIDLAGEWLSSTLPPSFSPMLELWRNHFVFTMKRTVILALATQLIELSQHSPVLDPFPTEPLKHSHLLTLLSCSPLFFLGRVLSVRNMLADVLAHLNVYSSAPNSRCFRYVDLSMNSSFGRLLHPIKETSLLHSLALLPIQSSRTLNGTNVSSTPTTSNRRWQDLSNDRVSMSNSNWEECLALIRLLCSTPVEGFVCFSVSFSIHSLVACYPTVCSVGNAVPTGILLSSESKGLHLGRSQATSIMKSACGLDLQMEFNKNIQFSASEWVQNIRSSITNPSILQITDQFLCLSTNTGINPSNRTMCPMLFADLIHKTNAKDYQYIDNVIQWFVIGGALLESVSLLMKNTTELMEMVEQNDSIITMGWIVKELKQCIGKNDRYPLLFSMFIYAYIVQLTSPDSVSTQDGIVYTDNFCSMVAFLLTITDCVNEFQDMNVFVHIQQFVEEETSKIATRSPSSESEQMKSVLSHISKMYVHFSRVMRIALVHYSIYS